MWMSLEGAEVSNFVLPGRRLAQRGTFQDGGGGFLSLIYSMHVCLPPTDAGGGGCYVAQCEQFVANRSDMTDAVGGFFVGRMAGLCVCDSSL